jgi:hypothetical protein
VLGQAYKQSLKTGDARVAKARAAEVNAKYEEIITKAKAGEVVEKPQPVRIVAPAFAPVTILGRVSVAELGKQYLNRRSNELQHGGFKSVRFSVGLFVSLYGRRPIGAVTKEDERGTIYGPDGWKQSLDGPPQGRDRDHQVSSDDFEYADETQQWFSVVFANNMEEARSRAFSLVAKGIATETGCIETPTRDPRKVRFMGRQLPAYRFIFCVLNEVAAGYDDVVRHRCNNRRCINPEHLEIGSRGENLQDERDFAANGVDFSLL